MSTGFDEPDDIDYAHYEYAINFNKVLQDATKNTEIVKHLREYLAVMADEPAEELIPIKNVYHDLKRMLGDEE